MQHNRIVAPDALYTAERGTAFMTGIQALVRLPMMQRRLDRRRGLDTAGFVTGYRGSPLGAYDQQLWKASRHLEAHDILFQPGLNEDLAATALWGAQMHKAFGPTRTDGVFGIWYGKGNGVDRSADAFRNANALGTSPLGGVLAIGGDDHAAQSSMFPHQTDGIFQSVMIPVLQPATVAEILSLGLAGLALSRFCGLWVAMKTIAEVVESAATFELPDPYPAFLAPADTVPPHGLNWDPAIAWPAQRVELERRMIEERLPAALAWARANWLDRPVLAGGEKRLCVVTVGKAHQDLMQALERLGVGASEARSLGMSVYKVAMSWPLDVASLFEFAAGFDEILVVEEKRPTVEDQLKAALYSRSAPALPRVVGKTGTAGEPLLPATLELSPVQVARALAARLPALAPAFGRLEPDRRPGGGGMMAHFAPRRPFFCSGCPHNSSTPTPEGSITGGGIGCHVMALSEPKLKTLTFSQMGGEGMQWVGAAPFSHTTHIFQNLGDGTYQHSGILAIRAAIAAGANITFKILYNDAVAMTGGQPAEGSPDPARVTRQLAAEGIAQILLVSDDPARWEGRSDLAPGVTVHHRDELDRIQRDLREVPGVTAILYEQTCAAEKRRRRKRGDFPDPDRRLFINPRVCEGCGDCSVQSNCIAVEPLDTEFGRKRRINQSSCNKDFSCLKGFCPSFVEIEGAVARKPDLDRLRTVEAELFPVLPQPERETLHAAFNIYVAGIGGLGVLTVGSLLGMAAHLEGLSATVLDFTGLAQKNGAVVSQVRIAPPGAEIHAARIGPGEIDLLLGTDMVVAAGADALTKLDPDRSAIVLNSNETPTADFVTDRDAMLPTPRIIQALRQRAGKEAFVLNATRLAEALLGDAVAANTLLLGYAWQRGLVPIGEAALREAIKANGAAVALNLRAFDWGRLAALDIAETERIAGLTAQSSGAETLEQGLGRRVSDLKAYQDRAYGARYLELVEHVRAFAAPLGTGGEAFVSAVIVNAYRLMAYKDEYEVARLYTEPAFRKTLEAQFAGARRISVHLAPPLLSRPDPRTGRPRKRKFGPWAFIAFRLLAKMKGVRGTWADPFGKSAERQAERALVSEYFETVAELCESLNADNLAQAQAIAALPAMVRGFGPVKRASMQSYAAERSLKLAAFRTQRLSRRAA